MKSKFFSPVLLIQAVILFLGFGNTRAQGVWDSIPLPAGVLQIGGGGCTFVGAGGDYAYVATNYGANLLRSQNGGSWDTVPLPPGVTQLGSNGAKFEGAGGGNLSGPHTAYVSANYGAELYVYDGSIWSAVSLPPGVIQLGGGGATFHGVGANQAIVSTNYGANIYQYDGSSWNPIPLPAGIIQLGSNGSLYEEVGYYLYVSNNFGMDILYYNGAWNSFPLPPSGASISGSSALQGAGYSQGAEIIYATTNNGNELYEYLGNTWNPLVLPPGVTQIGSNGSALMGASGPYLYAVSNFGANLYFMGTMLVSDQEKSRAEKLRISPNPAQRDFVIKSEQTETLLLLNQMGQQLRQMELNPQNNFTQQVSGLTPGIYFVSGKSGQQKIVVLE